MAEQQNRQLSITSPLGKDVLLLTKFTGEESFSSPFRFTLQLLSEKRDIKPEELVGKKVTFSIKLADAAPRFFNGYVSRLRGGRGDTRFRHYQAEVVPWLRLLEHTNDCRIFQNKTALEVIEAVFGDHKFATFKTDHVSKRGPAGILDRKIEYCVQYRESDLNFVSRLMEEHGIHYYFKHEDGKHTLILTDSKNNYPWCIEKEVEYVAGTAGSAAADGISDWSHNYEIRPSAWAYSDYDFKNPKTKQLSTISTLPSSNLPGRSGDLELEVFDYPGDYVKPAEGKQLAELRMGEEESAYNTVTGASACRSFMAGGKFKFKDPDQPDEDGKTYVLSKVVHEAEEPAEYESGGGAAPEVYKNTFECIPDAINFRAPRVTPKPFVKGVQTAVVSGPAGADVYPDEFGRVKVQFFWDRYGKNDDNSSCWLRVSQTWAGNTWGSMHIPWVGQEVIVDFLEGNPDRPIITGRVYNADQKVPLTLPAQKHANVVARDNYGNEIIFSHIEGDEHIRIHSPHYHSWIDIGRSVDLTTKSDMDKTTIGDCTTFTYGTSTTVMVGVEAKAVMGGVAQFVLGFVGDAYIGGKTEISIGAKGELTVAAVVDVTIGPTISCHVGPELVINNNSFTQATEGDITLDSNRQIGFIGGINDRSRMKMNNTEIVIGYKACNEGGKFNTQRGVLRAVASAILLAGSSVSSYFAGVTSGAARSKALADAETNPDIMKKPEVVEAKRYDVEPMHESTGQLAGLSMAQLAGIITLGMTIKDPHAKAFDHEGTDSEVYLNGMCAQVGAGPIGSNRGVLQILAKDGTVSMGHLQGQNKLVMEPGGDILISTPGGILNVDAQDTHIRKGTITHKNLTVKS